MQSTEDGKSLAKEPKKADGSKSEGVKGDKGKEKAEGVKGEKGKEKSEGAKSDGVKGDKEKEEKSESAKSDDVKGEKKNGSAKSEGVKEKMEDVRRAEDSLAIIDRQRETEVSGKEGWGAYVCLCVLYSMCGVV